MPALSGPIGAMLQCKVDQKHSNDLQNHAKTIAQINYELRHVIQNLKGEFSKKVHDPDQEWPCDLSEHVEKFNELRDIYQKFMEAGAAHLGEDAEALNIPELYSGDLAQMSKADLEKILRKVEDIAESHTDEVKDITNQLFLIGQLFITITDILRKADDGQRRFMERIAERSGMR
ncbi:MAG: hypothetical protein AB7N99_04065 [Simkaniaceae bacterium]